MEGFPTIERKENNENREQWVHRIKRLFGIWAFSAITAFAPMKEAQGQNRSVESMDSTDKIEWKTKEIKPSAELTDRIIKQKEWLLSYITSEKYKERYSKEYVRFYTLYDDDDSTFAAQFNTPIIKDGDTVAIVHALEKYSEGQVSASDFAKYTSLEGIFPSPDISKIDSGDLQSIAWDIELRWERVKRGKWIVVDSIKNAYGDFNLRTDTVRIVAGTPGGYETTPLHEFEHQSTKGDVLLDKVSKKILHTVAFQSTNEYFSDPTEILARINVLRYLLDAEGMYDAKKADFTGQDFEDMQKNQRIMKDINVRQLLRIFEKEDLIWIMNNIADANNGQQEIVHLA